MLDSNEPTYPSETTQMQFFFPVQQVQVSSENLHIPTIYNKNELKNCIKLISNVKNLDSEIQVAIIFY